MSFFKRVNDTPRTGFSGVIEIESAPVAYEAPQLDAGLTVPSAGSEGSLLARFDGSRRLEVADVEAPDSPLTLGSAPTVRRFISVS